MTEAYLNTHRDAVQNVVDAVLEALRREKSDRAFAEAELHKYLAVSDKAALDLTYDFYVNEVLAAGPLPQAVGITGDIQALAATNPKVKSLDPAAMLDQSFVRNGEGQRAANGGSCQNETFAVWRTKSRSTERDDGTVVAKSKAIEPHLEQARYFDTYIFAALSPNIL